MVILYSLHLASYFKFLIVQVLILILISRLSLADLKTTNK